MTLELALTPAGCLYLLDTAGDEKNHSLTAAWLNRVTAGFSAGQGAGLFALAATRPEGALSPSFGFWRDFAVSYLTRLCRTPETSGRLLEPVEPPEAGQWAAMMLAAPPMPGGEYLSGEVLHGLWQELDGWVRGEIGRAAGGLAGWLKKHAPLWRQVGRVCFHLAENKRDPDLPFAFLATYSPRLSTGGRVQYQPLGKALQEYSGERNKKALINLLSPVQRSAEQVPWVAELVESGDIFHPLAWTPGEAYRLLKAVPVLEASGLLVRLPDWWQRRPRPRVAVTIGAQQQSRLGLGEMLDFKIKLALGEETLSEQQWRELMAAEDGLINLKGQWIEVDREQLATALKHWQKVEARAAGEGISFIEGMRLLAGAPAGLAAVEDMDDVARNWSEVRAGGWLKDLLSELRRPGGLAEAELNREFRGVLRPYQQVGLQWLRLLTGLGLGACLADDMGLGKTVQVLSLLLAIKTAQTGPAQDGKPSLLVLPASLLANWKAEISRFAPSLSICFVHPSEPDDFTAVAAMQEGVAGNGVDLVVTSYAMVLRQKWLLDVDWRLVILDEAQAIKNPATRQTRAVKQLHAEARIALTGTPVENRLGDLWSLFDFLCPGLLGSAAAFKKFVKVLEGRQHDRYAPLRNLVSPYVLRRLKTDKSIIADLPEKTEMKAWCGLSKQQAVLYGRLVDELGRDLEGLDGMQRRGAVLACLMRLKQICNHPSQLLGDGGYRPDHSGKFARLSAIGEEIASRQEKVLVFTQFREMTEPVAAFLAGVFRREGLVLHGGTPVKKRRALIDLFQRSDGPPFFVLSLKAGGTGLNLTEASHVIHFDRWWNPAVENQATDRAFRIGQHRPVMVHKFICRGTVEEKIDALIEEKVSLADDILQAGAEALLTEMSSEELLKTVALDLQQAQL
ncbi:DEAD/DEAH box helicase [Desulfofustis glycolicus]|uniref:Non-specific serine/threonine protein kinase n=1 Tax=Desulfofustis glycolicus DSM 9705 TaxID=1121409 RepID=A0A1M5VQ83_9BACT|nr:DEAD/DEAH box helicase [Desulfofustis glycolicus]SHH77402.1 non-specific serine/threonine protein kinase [Desulfofustis glycolicus DSM 9705]